MGKLTFCNLNYIMAVQDEMIISVFCFTTVSQGFPSNNKLVSFHHGRRGEGRDRG